MGHPSPSDFDAWAKLADQDPAAFERARRELLMAEVAKAPESRRAELATLVEQLLAPQEGASGMQRAVHANNAMMKGLNALSDEWARLHRALGGSPAEAGSADMLARFTRLDARTPQRR